MTRLLQRRQFVRQASAAAVGLCLLRRETPAADDFTFADFEKLHQQLQPPADELWSTIPWKMEIVDACQQAAKEKKPLAMRVRSGHPLGCV